MRRLTDTARSSAAGDLSARVEPEGPSELVTLGEGFNAMLDTCERLVEQTTPPGWR